MTLDICKKKYLHTEPEIVLFNKSEFKIQYLQATFYADLACTLSAPFLIYQS